MAKRAHSTKPIEPAKQCDSDLKAWADEGYKLWLVEWVKKACASALEIVKKVKVRRRSSRERSASATRSSRPSVHPMPASETVTYT